MWRGERSFESGLPLAGSSYRKEIVRSKTFFATKRDVSRMGVASAGVGFGAFPPRLDVPLAWNNLDDSVDRGRYG
jgi:hypothetical protein